MEEQEHLDVLRPAFELAWDLLRQVSGKLSHADLAFESRQTQFLQELDSLEETLFELLKVPQFKTAWQLLRVGSFTLAGDLEEAYDYFRQAALAAVTAFSAVHGLTDKIISIKIAIVCINFRHTGNATVGYSVIRTYLKMLHGCPEVVSLYRTALSQRRLAKKLSHLFKTEDNSAGHLEDLVELSRCVKAHTGISIPTIDLHGHKVDPIDSVFGEFRRELLTTHLDLSLRQLTREEVESLSAELRSSLCLLTDLNLYDTGLGETGAVILADGLKQNTSLRKLNLWGNNIGAVGLSWLVDALKSNHFLTDLDLTENDIGVAGANSLAELLRATTALQYLKLWDNELKAEGTELIARALKQNTSLIYLNLARNDLGIVGAANLANALKSNSTLKFLHLYNNDLGDAGATTLASALAENHGLEQLEMVDNNISDPGALALARKLAENTTLQKIELVCNQIGDTGARSFAELLGTNSCLQKIDLELNQVGEEACQLLASAPRANPECVVLASFKQPDPTSDSSDDESFVIVSEAEALTPGPSPRRAQAGQECAPAAQPDTDADPPEAAIAEGGGEADGSPPEAASPGIGNERGLVPLPEDRELEEVSPPRTPDTPGSNGRAPAAGPVVITGVLTKQGAIVKSWKQRVFSLHRDGSLTYSKLNTRKTKGRVILADVTDVLRGQRAHPPSGWPAKVEAKLGFALRTHRRTYYFYATSTSDVDRWMTHVMPFVAGVGTRSRLGSTASVRDVPLAAVLRDLKPLP